MGGVLQGLVDVTPEVVVVAVQVFLHGVLGQLYLGEELYRLNSKMGRENTLNMLVVLLLPAWPCP